MASRGGRVSRPARASGRDESERRPVRTERTRPRRARAREGARDGGIVVPAWGRRVPLGPGIGADGPWMAPDAAGIKADGPARSLRGRPAFPSRAEDMDIRPTRFR